MSEQDIFSLKHLKTLIADKNISAIKEYMTLHNLKIEDGKIVPVDKAEYKAKFVFWDQRQHARKILLNSLYGALLNEACRFFDTRVGQSVTLTGRSITRHMNATINKIITGVYDYKGDGIIYSDTDSSYFSVECLFKDENGNVIDDKINDKDFIIGLYDEIGDATNKTFPGFMDKTFNTGIKKGGIIEAGRELVGIKGYFIIKKRYAILTYDVDGVRQDVDGKPGKLKAMGLDLKRSDTPKVMQDFLSKILTDLLCGVGEEDIINQIKEFRKVFNSEESWKKGTPKKVNGISDYTRRLTFDNDLLFESKRKIGDKSAKVTVPGHVRAAINWNNLRQANGDKYSMEIQDGQKVIVCKLKPNPMKITSIAYPVDQFNLPDWFKRLPFDDDEMEKTIIDMKIDNLLGTLEWDLQRSKIDTTFDDLFDF